jgi:hypothetical protein
MHNISSCILVAQVLLHDVMCMNGRGSACAHGHAHLPTIQSQLLAFVIKNLQSHANYVRNVHMSYAKY